MTWAGASLTRTVRWLLIATAAAYAVVFVAALAGRGGALISTLGLSRVGLGHGWIWQPVTYLFVHANTWHLLMNLLTLFMFGPEMERALGRSAFAAMYFAGGIIGGIAFVLVAPRAVCVGASGAVFAVMASFAWFFPRRPIGLLFPPVSLPAWLLVSILAFLDLDALIRGGGSVAHAAHLAGALVGVTWGWVFKRPVPPDPIAWLRRRRRESAEADRQADESEVDRILDKISTQGFGALTRRERSTLERARRNRRPG